MKTQWDFANLLYSSESDPRIEQDMRAIQTATRAFAKKYKHTTTYTSSVTALQKALEDYEAVFRILSQAKPVLYFLYRKDVDTSNQKIAATFNQLFSEYTHYQNEIIFFELALQKIDTATQRTFLRSSKLLPWNYFLKQLFATAKHSLSEEAEQVMNMKFLPSHQMWVQAHEKMLNEKTIVFQDKKLPISEALNILPKQSTKDRRSLAKSIDLVLKSMGDVAEAEINAVVVNKKINDHIRGYAKPYSERLLQDQVGEQTLIALLDSTTDAFALSHRFYELKKQLHGFSALKYCDRQAQLGKVTQQYSFKESVVLLREVLSGLDPRYASILDTFVTQGHIDVYPKTGKRGGGYCSSAVDMPTMILLNHTDDASAILTLAHEMGHAIHSELSKKQPPLYVGYSTAVAEVASTFFEGMMFEKLVENASKKDQIRLLHDHILGSIASIFRQVAFFNFELELHQTVREQGGVDQLQLAQIMKKHLASYLGPAVDVTENDGYTYVYVGHIRMMFYVYSYAYGELVSRALMNRYKADSSYIKSIHSFLESGGSKKPADIFKRIGITTTKQSFWKEGLALIEQDINTLERLVKSS